MRRFTLFASALFAAGGLWMIASGNPSGWLVAGFFGLCLLIAVLEPWFPKLPASREYRLSITQHEIACELPERKRESIRWEDVNRIWYVTTSDGPLLPAADLVRECPPIGTPRLAAVARPAADLARTFARRRSCRASGGPGTQS